MKCTSIFADFFGDWVTNEVSMVLCFANLLIITYYLYKVRIKKQSITMLMDLGHDETYSELSFRLLQFLQLCLLITIIEMILSIYLIIIGPEFANIFWNINS